VLQTDGLDNLTLTNKRVYRTTNASYIDVWHERRKMQELSDPVSMARVHLIQHLQKLSKDQRNIVK